MNKAFIKWAGGKRKLLPIILPELEGYKRLLEPFVGSGVVFLNCENPEIIINDFNKDLINVYQQVYKNLSLFTTALDKVFKGCNSQADFSRLRTEFNSNETEAFRKAVLFIYLNRHCFNGLCQYNSSGKFNVSYGKYKTVYFPEKELQQANELLHNKKITMLSGDFSAVFALANKGDVIYCDPPYVPISETAHFTSYTAGGFSFDQHKQLVQLSETAQKNDIKVLISNHDTEATRNLYKNASKIIELNVRRSISCNSTSRIKVKELIAIY